MGYQFLHVEMYARSASKLAGAKRAKKGAVRESDGIRKNWSAREILAEALREEKACPHVKIPRPPDVLVGDLRALADELDKSEPPKGQRKDTPILLAGVASAPWPPGDLRSAAWREDTVEHLQRKFGKDLRAVVGHSDEQYDHLHFYVCAPGLKPIKSLHPGQAARAESAARDEDAKAQIAAYNAAMKKWQDGYSEEVAKQHGLLRIGPRRQRVTRNEWMEQKRAAELNASRLKEANDRLARAEEIERARRSADEMLRAREARVEVGEVDLAEKRKKLKQAAKTLQEIDGLLEAKGQWLADAVKILPAAFQESFLAVFDKGPPYPLPTPEKPLVGRSDASQDVDRSSESIAHNAQSLKRRKPSL